MSKLGATKAISNKILTQRERDVIAHAQQLSETDDLVLRRNADLLHFVNSKANGILVVRCHHDSDALGVSLLVFQDLQKKNALRTIENLNRSEPILAPGTVP